MGVQDVWNLFLLKRRCKWMGFYSIVGRECAQQY
jgi:hypothetical protein